jgi:hypothetical protein
MMALSLFGTVSGLEVRTYGQLPIQVADEWIALNSGELMLLNGTSAVCVSRRQTEAGILTWIGLYRPALEMTSDRGGGCVGAGIWLLNKSARGRLVVDLLTLLTDQLVGLAMSGGRFVRRISAAESSIHWHDEVGKQISQSLTDLEPTRGGVTPSDLPKAFLDASGNGSAAQLGMYAHAAQHEYAFAGYRAVFVSTDAAVAESARRCGRLAVLTPEECRVAELAHEKQTLRELIDLRGKWQEADAAKQTAIDQIGILNEELDAQHNKIIADARRTADVEHALATRIAEAQRLMERLAAADLHKTHQAETLARERKRFEETLLEQDKRLTQERQHLAQKAREQEHREQNLSNKESIHASRERNLRAREQQVEGQQNALRQAVSDVADKTRQLNAVAPRLAELNAAVSSERNRSDHFEKLSSSTMSRCAQLERRLREQEEDTSALFEDPQRAPSRSSRLWPATAGLLAGAALMYFATQFSGMAEQGRVTQSADVYMLPPPRPDYFSQRREQSGDSQAKLQDSATQADVAAKDSSVPAPSAADRKSETTSPPRDSTQSSPDPAKSSKDTKRAKKLAAASGPDSAGR